MYDLNTTEARQYQEIKDGLQSTGGRLCQLNRDGDPELDGNGNPIPVDYVVLRGRRHLVDRSMRVWQYHPEGSSKSPQSVGPAGAPYRSNRVDMWSGQWVTDGQQWIKHIIAVPIDKRINGHPGMTQIDWYMTNKGYKHPLDDPHQPDGRTIAAIEGRRVATAAEVDVVSKELEAKYATDATDGHTNGGGGDTDARDGEAPAADAQGEAGTPHSTRTNREEG